MKTTHTALTAKADAVDLITLQVLKTSTNRYRHAYEWVGFWLKKREGGVLSTAMYTHRVPSLEATDIASQRILSTLELAPPLDDQKIIWVYKFTKLSL